MTLHIFPCAYWKKALCVTQLLNHPRDSRKGPVSFWLKEHRKRRTTGELMVFLLPLIIVLMAKQSDARSHTYQRMIGCELMEDGSTTGFLQYAYDGQDFMIFDKDTLSWLAVDNVAHTIKRAWEANQHELQYQKNWLEEECIAWLKRFLEYGKDTLQRTEIYMTWMKNGEEIVQEMDYGDILPSGDGTYQRWASVELDPQSSDLYSCHVEHCGVHMVLQVPQESETIPLMIKAVSGSIVLVIVLAGVGVLVWRRRPREQNGAIYFPTPDR
ncbi:major histocompatibility complex class I-related gene protein isoform X4 [Aotus nancymaae]|uniref:major histocompatibility complex class I-related gene protein isoform X4 n=1 Tax=Aotus nancymaae TaxID=37293 RepID=UPI0030FEAD68